MTVIQWYDNDEKVKANNINFELCCCDKIAQRHQSQKQHEIQFPSQRTIVSSSSSAVADNVSLNVWKLIVMCYFTFVWFPFTYLSVSMVTVWLWLNDSSHLRFAAWGLPSSIVIPEKPQADTILLNSCFMRMIYTPHINPHIPAWAQSHDQVVICD